MTNRDDEGKAIYKTADLCAGIGGMRRAFEMTGRFKNVLSAEIDKAACRTYKHLYGDDPFNDIMSDEFIEKVDESDFEVLLAGFPCQAFSSVGNEEGFNDKEKGTIFFHIVRTMSHHRPQAILLENVENLVRHQGGKTFRRILNELEKRLDYKVIGVSKSDDGSLVFEWRDFVRNSKCFGIPQNRPRAYIVAFDRKRFGDDLLSLLPDKLPDHRDETIFGDLKSILELNADPRYYLSSGYLQTLKRHRTRQKGNGNGFGYKVVNAEGVVSPCASTIMATGGSGKERNLVYDPQEGIASMPYPTKRSPLNDEGIRFMTPNEWGKLQGFIGYAFMEDGEDRFSFPDGTSDAQKYKQFGNSVTIPVIRTFAEFIAEWLDEMNSRLSQYS